MILAKTKKGYDIGEAAQGRITTHLQKKLEREDPIAFGNRFDLPLSDEQATTLAFYKPADVSPETRDLQAAGNEMSTTMAFVRTLTAMLKDAALGLRVVPIVADEARASA